MGGPRRAQAPKVTTTPAPETAVIPDPDTTAAAAAVVSATPDGGAGTPDAETSTSAPVETPDPAATQDPDGTPDPATPDPTPAPVAATAVPTPETGDAVEEPVDVSTVVMNIAITGTVDGEPWPAPGGEISLPTAEAERYVRLGYARFPEK